MRSTVKHCRRSRQFAPTYDNISGVLIAGILDICADAGEAGDLGPGGAGVGGLPEAISTSGTEIKGCREIRVNDQSLSETTEQPK